MTPDRLPPHDADSEAALLGGFLLGNREVIFDIQAVHPDLARYPYELRHQTILGAILALVNANEPVDTVTVKAQLDREGKLSDAGGIEYLATLPEKSPSASNCSHYAELLREKFIKRRAIQAGTTVCEQAFNGVSTTAELLDTIERELNGISLENAPQEANMHDLVRDCIDEIEHAHSHQGQPRGLTTGFSDLDRITHGLRPGQLIVIGARPGEGKTTLATNIAEHVSLECGKHVGIVELEMTAKELTLRMISSRSNVPLDRLLSGNLLEEHFRQIMAASAAINKAPLRIADEDGITIAQLKAKVRRMHRKHNLALVIVDYLQLVRPSRPNASRNVEVSEISASLKALAKELKVPLIALSQLNRDSDTDNRPPKLRDLRDSGSIEQDADIVGLLHRPKPDEDLVHLDIAKHRQGPKRKLKLVFFGETFRFRTTGKI